MDVPYIDLQRFEDGFLARWAERCAALTAGTRYVGAPEVERLEARLAEWTGAAEVVACANGTDALQLALRAVGVGPGDVVVIPDATFWATFEAVVNVGARAVTVDVDPDDLQMDFGRFVEAVERHRPRAAILVHLYGWGSARLDDFRAQARERGLPLVEDGAQAFGATWRGRPLYEGAELATISFYPAKVLGACGDAGAVTCRDPALAAEVRRLGNHGRTDHFAHGAVGWNSRMGGFEAAYLDLSLDHLPGRLASRRRAAARYRAGLAALGLATGDPPAGHAENGYVNVTLPEPARRPALEAALGRAGIGFANVYPGTMSEQPAAAPHLAGRAGGGHARRLARSVLNLPLFAHIRDDEVDRVLAVVADAIAPGAGRPAVHEQGRASGDGGGPAPGTERATARSGR